MRFIRNQFARFGREDRGAILAEAVLVLPFMFWAFLGLFVYWDAFRAMNKVQKASYTISDMISREMVTINDAYITGMDTLMERLIDTDQDVTIRVTSVTWNEDNNRFEVHWSRSTGSLMPRLTTTTLQNYASLIPDMSDGDYVVIVESSVRYTPAFNIGMGEQELSQFIVTRPRFVPKVCLSGVACS
jgi:Flp pilus assembly protein TadG